MILEAGVITATNTDLMSVGRLNAIPYNGMLTMQFQADEATAVKNFSLTVQKPNGDVPIDKQIVHAGAVGAVGTLDSRTWLELKFQATQGGHFNVALEETGNAILAYRLILSP